MDLKAEPSSSASERHQRIQERRNRIKAKLDELNRSSEESKREDVVVADSIEAVTTSNAERAVYDALAGYREKATGFQAHVEALKARADREALTIFANDQQAAVVRRTALENERASFSKVDAAFAMKWSSLVEKDTPEELAAGLLELRSLVLGMLASKDGVIAAFEDYLSVVDDDYLRLVREESAEVDEVIAYMRRVMQDLKAFSAERVRQCHDVFAREQAEYVRTREDALDALREGTLALETAGLETRQRLAEEHNGNVTEQLYRDYDEYTALKRRLEAEGVALRYQLEEMRSVYQLNSDKLDYNYKLLAARDIECQNLIVQQKKKIAKLQGQITTLIARHATVDGKLRAENLALSTSYKRMANLYCELQLRFKHFERSDTQRFRSLWAFHERRIATALKDLLLAEQIIKESVLCSEEKRGTDEGSVESVVATILRKLQAAAGVAPLGEDGGALDGGEGAGAATAGNGNGGGNGSILDITRSIDPLSSCAVGPAVAGHVLGQLAAEARFLASDDLLGVLAPGEEITPRMRTDALLSTLGVRNASELDLLFAHITQAGKGYDLLSREKIVDGLRAFARDVVQRRAQSKEAAGTAGTAVAGSRQQAGIWSRSAQEAFWRELGSLISPEKQTMWGILQETLRQYQEVLQARTDLVQRNDQMAAQNEELRGLLQVYISQERQTLHAAGVSQPVELAGQQAGAASASRLLNANPN